MFKGNASILKYAGGPVMVAWWDAHPPGMLTVSGSILTSGNILLWRLVME